MQSKIKPENYITIMGWMITNLQLSGNELMIFAIIYGFAQDGESKFTGSLKYLEDFSTSSKSTVKRSLEELVSKGFIIKESKLINSLTFNSYSTPDGISKWTAPVHHDPGQLENTGVKLDGGRGHGELGGGVMVNPNILLDNKEDTNTGVSGEIPFVEAPLPLPKQVKKEKKKFAPPTLKEVKDFFKSECMKEEIAVKAFDHYAKADWHDRNNNPVLNWKQKMRTNWFNEENKINTELKQLARKQIVMVV